MECARLASVALLGLVLAMARPAVAEKVDLELVLAVDVSGSMDADELKIQRDGYVAALAHPDVVRAIQGGYTGRIGIVYVEWAGPASQVVVVPWSVVHDRTTAEAFATAVAAAVSTRIHGTSISGSLAFAASLFDDNGLEGVRRVIDISGDGPNNMGAPVEPVRDAVVRQGITINGLPLIIRPSLWASRIDLGAYYRDCVIGGPGAFLVPVEEIGRIGEAVRRKLVFEIAGLTPTVMPAAWRPAAAGPKADCLIGEALWGRWRQFRE